MKKAARKRRKRKKDDIPVLSVPIRVIRGCLLFFFVIFATFCGYSAFSLLSVAGEARAGSSVVASSLPS